MNTKLIVKDPEKRPITTKPTDNNKITKRKNEIGADQKNSLDKIEDNRCKTVTIIGDSIISYQDEKLHTNKKRVVKVRSYPGATTDHLIDYCRLVAHRQPDIIIVHVGTHDLRSKDEKEIAQII